MKQLSKEDKSKLVQFYWSSRSIVATKRRFRAHFKTRVTQCARAILRLQEKFLRKGSVLNLTKGSCGRPTTKRTPQNIARVKSVITQDPEKSVRKIAQQVGTSICTVHRILIKDLKLFPYKLAVHHQLSDDDKRQMVTFATWLKSKTASDPNFFQRVWFSDEAHFHLTGQVNSQNCRLWASNLPDIVLETPPHSPGVTVWCAMSSSGIIGPFLFEDAGTATLRP